MFILKSRSPRRIEILNHLGLRFLVDPEDVDETGLINEQPLDYLRRIVFLKLGNRNLFKVENVYLACDTIVVFENQILHKPANLEEAFHFLSRLNGKSHSVFSGCVINSRGKMDYFYEETKIQFHHLTESQIRTYLSTASPLDKAGGYGIQDPNCPVASWIGSYTNVMGFPIRGFFARWNSWFSDWK